MYHVCQQSTLQHFLPQRLLILNILLVVSSARDYYFQFHIDSRGVCVTFLWNPLTKQIRVTEYQHAILIPNCKSKMATIITMYEPFIIDCIFHIFNSNIRVPCTLHGSVTILSSTVGVPLIYTIEMRLSSGKSSKDFRHLKFKLCRQSYDLIPGLSGPFQRPVYL